MDAPYIERSALILGSGAAGSTCQAILDGLGIASRLIQNKPAKIQRLYGQYLVTLGNGATGFYRSSVLVLAPSNAEEQIDWWLRSDWKDTAPGSARPGVA